MTAWLLLSFVAVATTATPRVLRRTRWVERSPLLGIVMWYCVLTATITATAAAIMSMLVPMGRKDPPLCLAWRWCLQAAQGEHGAAGQLVAATVTATTAVLAVRLVVCSVRLMRALGHQRRQHLQLLCLAGSERPELGAVVVSSPEAAAYMVVARRPQVVVTTGAIACLSREELAAVLAHERAHAAGRHDVLVNAVRLLHDAFPGLSLFAIAEQQLVRLVELRADEVATRHYRPISLARALVALAGSGAADVPPGAVRANGGDAMGRLNRLLDPPERLPLIYRTAIGAGALAIAVTPVLALLISWLVPAQSTCPPGI